MGRKSIVINLSAEEREYLETQTRARTIQAQTVNRARILLLKAEGCPINEIADKVGINRKSVMLCLNKYAEGGVENALFDAPGRGRNAEITDDEKAWIINIACQKPIDFGYAAETWTYAKLTSHINKNAEAAGFTRLSTIHKSTVHSILDEAEIKPFRIKYYGRKINRRSMCFLMMKSLGYKRLPQRLQIFFRMRITVQSAGIMNINALGQCPCWQGSICRLEKPSR